jgi:23S rRNA (adenine1618-N6)-methyltransferase
MKAKQHKVENEKKELHPRNPHNSRYDFEKLCATYPALSEYVFVNQYNSQTINFAEPNAVKALNCALLKHFYNVDYWDIPANYLCPPIPGRADYIHYVADLLAESNNNVIPTGSDIKVLDIGVGANCIYPIIGYKSYGWNFVGSEIDVIALESARQINRLNKFPFGAITFRKQNYPNEILKGVIQPNEKFDLTICNPPFHASSQEAEFGSLRKVKNLGLQKEGKPLLNFSGKRTELMCDGGEVGFISRMIEESAQIPTSCKWFTSLVSKKEHLHPLYKILKEVQATKVRTISMAQGQKTSRILAWTFHHQI